MSTSGTPNSTDSQHDADSSSGSEHNMSVTGQAAYVDYESGTLRQLRENAYRMGRLTPVDSPQSESRIGQISESATTLFQEMTATNPSSAMHRITQAEGDLQAARYAAKDAQERLYRETSELRRGEDDLANAIAHKERTPSRG